VGVIHRSAASDLAAGAWAMLSTATFTGLAPIFRVYVPEGTTCPYAVIHFFTHLRHGFFCCINKRICCIPCIHQLFLLPVFICMQFSILDELSDLLLRESG
jgi:hypothetical protein